MTGDSTRLGAAIHAIFRAILREMPSTSTVVAECRLDDRGPRRSAMLVVAPDATVQASYDAPASAFDEKRGGLGLALPIARRVVEAHGGRLYAPASTKEGPDTAARGAAIVTIPLETIR